MSKPQTMIIPKSESFIKFLRDFWDMDYEEYTSWFYDEREIEIINREYLKEIMSIKKK